MTHHQHDTRTTQPAKEIEMNDQTDPNAHEDDDTPKVYACPNCGQPCHETPQRYGNGWRDCPTCGWRESSPTDLAIWLPVPCDWCGEVEGGGENPWATHRDLPTEGYYHDGCWESHQENEARTRRDAEYAAAVAEGVIPEDTTPSAQDATYCGADFMAGTLCTLSPGHEGPHDQPEFGQAADDELAHDLAMEDAVDTAYLPTADVDPDGEESGYRPVDCPTCLERIDVGGPGEEAHMVFAVRANGDRSNLGWCPNGVGGWDYAVRQAATTWGRAQYQGQPVTIGSHDPRPVMVDGQPAPHIKAEEEMTPARALELAIFALNTIAEPDASAHSDLETLDRESQRALATLTAMHQAAKGGE